MSGGPIAGGPGAGHPGDLLSALLDGELAPAEAAAVVTHLDRCPACATERDEVAASRAALRALPALEAPPGVLRALPTIHLGDLISARLDAEVALDLGPGIDAHLAACPACGAEHDEVAAGRTALRRLPPVEPPVGVLRPRAAWAAPAPGGPRPLPQRTRRRRAATATVAVAAAVAGVFGLVGRPAPADTSRPAVASFVAQHSTSSPGPDTVSGLAPAAVPVSFTR